MRSQHTPCERIANYSAIDNVPMATNDPDVSILIVGYNSSAYLDRCIGSIAPAIVKHSYEVLFVNNGTDESENLLAACHPRVRVFESQGNIGFAAANNYLADHASGRYVLLLNPDTTLYPDAVDILVDAAIQNPHFEVLGGITVGDDGTPEVRAQVVLPSLTTILRGLIGRAGQSVDLDPLASIVEVDALNGGFMLIRRECWFKLGGLDEAFFLYSEELDFLKRLRDRGGRVGQVSGSRIYHDIGSGEVYSPARVRFRATGNAHYFHKHFSTPYAYTCVALMWLEMMARHWGGRLLGVKNERYARMSRGFADVVRTPWTWMWGYNSAGADPRKRT